MSKYVIVWTNEKKSKVWNSVTLCDTEAEAFDMEKKILSLSERNQAIVCKVISWNGEVIE